MSNKELAVQIRCAVLQAEATVMSNPKYSGKDGKVIIPSFDELLMDIKILTEELSKIPD